MSAASRFLARRGAPGFFLSPAACLVAAALGLTACAHRSAPGPLAASVNGRPITVAQWCVEQRLLGEPSADGVEALNDLIDEALIAQQGRRLGVRFSAQDKARVEREALADVDLGALDAGLKDLGLTREQWLERIARDAEEDAVVQAALRPTLRVGVQEVRDHYWEHLLEYRRSPRRVLLQIYTRTRSAAEKAMRAVDRGKPFAAVARALGQGPEAAQGGLLGAVTRDDLPPTLARAAWRLKPGTHSGIIASHWGYHILYLEGLVPGDPGSLKEAAPAVRDAVLLDKEQTAYRSWLAGLRESADIRIWVGPDRCGPAESVFEKGNP